MKKEKGFTLIELLAVIVILAIIALIAVPMVLKILNQARKSAAEDSTYGIAETASSYIADFMIANGGDFPAEALEFECKNDKCTLTEESKSKLTGLKYENELKIKGNRPKDGTVKILNGGHTIIATDLKINGFICQYDNEKASCDEKKQETAILDAFAKDSWDTIAANVRAGKTSNYHVGDTKIVKMDVDGDGTPENYSVRIVNKETPEECLDDEFSQSACGFVVEFGGSINPPKDSNGNLITKRTINAKTYLEGASATATPSENTNYINDIISLHRMNPAANYYYEEGTGNIGSWEYSEMRKYLNNEIYYLLPTDLRNAITYTKLITEHGLINQENSTTTDKLYLLSSDEIGYSIGYVASIDKIRTLDFYRINSNYNDKMKKYNNTSTKWWLRTPISYNESEFCYVRTDEDYYQYTENADVELGVAPAFRLLGPDSEQPKHAEQPTTVPTTAQPTATATATATE